MTCGDDWKLSWLLGKEITVSEHINADGEFQSDKYPACPAGKVPLSVKDKTAQDLLWEYAQRRRHVDAAFADDLEKALRAKGFDPANSALASREKTIEDLRKLSGSADALIKGLLDELVKVRHAASLTGAGET